MFADGALTVSAKPVIAIDADGVLLDYGAAYPRAWQRAFGSFPRERDPNAYWPLDRWEVERLTGERLEAFRRQFDETFWSSIPAMPGAIEATNVLHDAGFELVCVSALDRTHEQARLRNLRELGFPIERVIATPHTDVGNPKAAALTELQPIAFLDDYLPYLTGLPPNIHTALLRSHMTGSPNHGQGRDAVRSTHADLADFAKWWLQNQRPSSGHHP